EEALRLDPHCGQAHMMMAKILAWSDKSIERDKTIKQEVDPPSPSPKRRLPGNDSGPLPNGHGLARRSGGDVPARHRNQSARTKSLLQLLYSAGEEARRVQSALGFGSLPGTRAGIRLLSALARDCGIRLDRRGGANEEISC